MFQNERPSFINYTFELSKDACLNDSKTKTTKISKKICDFY